jgi:replication factor C subunit 1
VKKSLKPEPESIVVKKEVESKPVNPNNESAATLLWVDKYKPKSMNKVIGQLGDKSNASKLLNWLKNWNKFHMNASSGGKKAWNDQETGSSFKCALLSGPPGIGKTTTAQLACTEAGYTFVELNASDSRSKKLLDSVLGESTETASIDSYMKGKHKVNDFTHDKHCIIMDEVDGMAGNEDRGVILLPDYIY